MSAGDPHLFEAFLLCPSHSCLRCRKVSSRGLGASGWVLAGRVAAWLGLPLRDAPGDPAGLGSDTPFTTSAPSMFSWTQKRESEEKLVYEWNKNESCESELWELQHAEQFGQTKTRDQKDSTVGLSWIYTYLPSPHIKLLKPNWCQIFQDDQSWENASRLKWTKPNHLRKSIGSIYSEWTDPIISLSVAFKLTFSSCQATWLLLLIAPMQEHHMPAVCSMSVGKNLIKNKLIQENWRQHLRLRGSRVVTTLASQLVKWIHSNFLSYISCSSGGRSY